MHYAVQAAENPNVCTDWEDVPKILIAICTPQEPANDSLFSAPKPLIHGKETGTRV